MTAIRNARGRFVPKNNPLVVIGALQAVRDKERAEQALRQQQERRDNARRRGYNGPFTRAELAAMVVAE